MGKPHYQHGLGAHSRGLKLAASTHVLSILDEYNLSHFLQALHFTITYYLLWEPEPVCLASS